jgi:hypothetical protein
VTAIEAQLCEQMREQADLTDRPSTIPCDRTVARPVIAEVGMAMSAFPRAAIWRAGYADECGERGQALLKPYAQGRSLPAQHAGAARMGGGACQGPPAERSVFRIASKRDPKKAAVAVATGHRILTIVWRVVRDGMVCQERRGD